MARAKRGSASTVVRAAAATAAVLIVAAIVLVRLAGSTLELDLGESAATDSGEVRVTSWGIESDETLVSFDACRTGSGATVDLSAFRLVSADVELEPSGSRMEQGATPSPDCVRGLVVFPAVERIDHVAYLASPRVEWRDPHAAASEEAT